MKAIGRSIRALALVGCGVTAGTHAQTNWPLQPTTDDHALGAVMGEFQLADTIYQHQGIDLLVKSCQAAGTCSVPCPASGTTTASTAEGCVYSTVEAPVFQCANGATDKDTTAILNVNGAGMVTFYTYTHLRRNEWDAAFMEYCQDDDGVDDPDLNGVDDSLPVGSPINRVGHYSNTCDLYHHLHYEIWEMRGTHYEFVNALARIDEDLRPDTQPPDVFGVYLARHGPRWTPFPAIGTCTLVDGRVDVIAHLRDRDDAGSTGPMYQGATNVGVYNLRWRACPPTNPNCAWIDTHKYDRMSTTWADQPTPPPTPPPPNPYADKHFSTTSPYESIFEQCPAQNPDGTYPVNQTFMVATSEPSTFWDTANGPNGTYTVSVEASDLAGNVSVATINACVRNASCGDLVIRDAVDDVGAVPYTGPVFYLSPDITANPGGVDENKNIREDLVNNVAVQVWNKGTCNLPAGTTYQVCLGWSPPSGSIPFPLPANQTVACLTETVPAGGWAQNTARTTPFSWLPLAGTLPQGHACLVAWSSSNADLPQTTPSVVYDNNRAQRNIAFVALPAAGETSSADYWIYDLPELFERSVQFSFHFDRPPPVPWNLSVAVPPSFRVRGLANARVIGSFRARGADALDRCLAGDEASCVHQCSNDEVLEERACTVVLGGFAGEGPVVLHGIEVDEPVKLRLAVTGPRSGPRGGPFEIRVTERGALLGQPAAPVGGVTYRFEEPSEREREPAENP